MSKKERMYKETKTWNPFVGCYHDCVYCKPSFQKVVAWVGRMKGCSKYDLKKEGDGIDNMWFLLWQWFTMWG
jgi:hypothetical protein